MAERRIKVLPSDDPIGASDKVIKFSQCVMERLTLVRSLSLPSVLAEDIIMNYERVYAAAINTETTDYMHILLSLIKIKFQKLKQYFRDRKDKVSVIHEIQFIDSCLEMLQPSRETKEFFAIIQEFIICEKEWKFEVAKFEIKLREKFILPLRTLYINFQREFKKTQRDLTKIIKREATQEWDIPPEKCSELLSDVEMLLEDVKVHIDALELKITNFWEHASHNPTEQYKEIIFFIVNIRFCERMYKVIEDTSNIIRSNAVCQCDNFHELIEIFVSMRSQLAVAREAAKKAEITKEIARDKAAKLQEARSVGTDEAVIKRAEIVSLQADKDAELAVAMAKKAEQEAEQSKAIIDERTKHWHATVIRIRQQKEIEKLAEKQRQQITRKEEDKLAQEQRRKELSAIKEKSFILFRKLSVNNFAILKILLGIEQGSIRYSQLTNLFGPLETQIPGSIKPVGGGSHRKLIINGITPAVEEFEAYSDEEVIKGTGGLFVPHGKGDSYLPPIVIEMVKNTLVRANIFPEHLHGYIEEELQLVQRSQVVRP